MTAPWRPLGLAISLLAALVGTAFGQTEAGTPLRIGLRFPPPANQATNQRIYTAEGLEAAVAERIATGLAVPARFVRIAPDDEAAALARGDIDVLVTRSARIPAPTQIGTGFITGLSVAIRSDTTIKDWSQLAGRSLCVVAGRDEAAALAASTGATIRTEAAPAKALIALRTGRCDAALGDAALLQKLFAEPEWDRFSATLPPRARDELVVVPGPHLASTATAERLAGIVAAIDWDAAIDRWSRLVALEVYLDQDGPDCH
jgi:polar amino acid transport system substrate-binding protein